MVVMSSLTFGTQSRVLKSFGANNWDFICVIPNKEVWTIYTKIFEY
jgi:hypothetical protein